MLWILTLPVCDPSAQILNVLIHLLTRYRVLCVKGTAIYIFFTLFYNEGEQVTVNTECHFTLDNEPPVFFNHTGDPTIPPKTKRDYQALVFSKAGLESVPHHMKISMSDVSYHVFLSFDFAQYT